MTEPASMPGDVVRARLDFSYDGTNFCGWAMQPGLRTVQQVLEEALGRVVRVAGRELPLGSLRTTVAGRTDSGVHARGQVAHVDILREAWERLPGRASRTPADALRERLTGVLPDDVVITGVREAPAGFDARFSAQERRYAYRLCDLAAHRDPLARTHVLWHHNELDVDALQAASATLTGLRDFAAFCKPREGATTIRDLKEFSWARAESGLDTGLVVATLRADAFCHSMVRGLVGAVLMVGEARRSLDWLAGIAAGTERSPSISVAPAKGLTLEHVAYPPDADVAAQALRTRARRA